MVVANMHNNVNVSIVTLTLVKACMGYKPPNFQLSAAI